MIWKILVWLGFGQYDTVETVFTGTAELTRNLTGGEIRTQAVLCKCREIHTGQVIAMVKTPMGNFKIDWDIAKSYGMS